MWVDSVNWISISFSFTYFFVVTSDPDVSCFLTLLVSILSLFSLLFFDLLFHPVSRFWLFALSSRRPVACPVFLIYFRWLFDRGLLILIKFKEEEEKKSWQQQEEQLIFLWPEEKKEQRKANVTSVWCRVKTFLPWKEEEEEWSSIKTLREKDVPSTSYSSRNQIFTSNRLPPSQDFLSLWQSMQSTERILYWSRHTTSWREGILDDEGIPSIHGFHANNGRTQGIGLWSSHCLFILKRIFHFKWKCLLYLLFLSKETA